MLSRFRVVVVLMALAFATVSATPTFAAKGGGKGANSFTGSFSLVLLNSTDGLPHYGQDVTFNVSSTAPYPSVTLTCYQNGVWVTNQTAGGYQVGRRSSRSPRGSGPGEPRIAPLCSPIRPARVRRRWRR